MAASTPMLNCPAQSAISAIYRPVCTQTMIDLAAAKAVRMAAARSFSLGERYSVSFDYRPKSFQSELLLPLRHLGALSLM
jgi:hypothetical protein